VRDLSAEPLTRAEELEIQLSSGRLHAQRFGHEVPGARVVEVDANHYGTMTADATVAALRAFQSG